jgi:hypothetical protein
MNYSSNLTRRVLNCSSSSKQTTKKYNKLTSKIQMITEAFEASILDAMVGEIYTEVQIIETVRLINPGQLDTGRTSNLINRMRKEGRLIG